MKCPKCWAYEAYVHHAKRGWKGFLLSCLLFVPMKCQHCFHKFHVFWPFTVGQQMEPPAIRTSNGLVRGGRPGAARRPAEKESPSPDTLPRVRKRSQAI